MGNHHSVSAETGNRESSLDADVTGTTHKKNEGGAEQDGLHISIENRHFIEAHPALQRLLNSFVTEIREKNPQDLISFGLDYLSALQQSSTAAVDSEICPVVIAGPSGVGKGALITRLLATYPDAFGFSVSHTTRGPRPGEVDGQHYHFVAKDAFEAALAENAFVEHANVHTNYYGTSFAAIDKVSSHTCSLRYHIYVFTHSYM